ncbi:MAG: hypothetical protein ACPIA2_07295 [Mariniblastus sp.]
MADPFKPQSSQQLIREAKIGLSVVALLFATLIYVGTLRMTGQTPILSFKPTAGSANADAVPPPPKEPFLNSANAPFGQETQPPQKSDQMTIGTSEIEPPKEDQRFVPLVPKIPNTIKVKPKFEFKRGVASFGDPSADFKSPDQKNNRFSLTPPKTNGNFSPSSDRLKQPVASPIGPRAQESPSNNDNLTYAQFETRPSEAHDSEKPISITTETPRISSFINPKLEKTKKFLPPLPIDPIRSKAPTQEISKEIELLNSPKPMVGFKNPPPNFVAPDLDLSKKLKPIDGPSSLRIYKTEPGDTYWTISQKIYEDGRYFRALFRHNEVKHPEYKLVPGLELNTPVKSELERMWPAECPRASVKETSSIGKSSSDANAYYVTSAGETLFGIARQKLNQASRFGELYQLNRDLIGSDVQADSPLRAGLKLILPN